MVDEELDGYNKLQLTILFSSSHYYFLPSACPPPAHQNVEI